MHATANIIIHICDLEIFPVIYFVILFYCLICLASGILSYLSDNLERDYILQILYSATTYIENNYSANLLKVWINDIRIKEVKINSAKPTVIECPRET